MKKTALFLIIILSISINIEAQSTIEWSKDRKLTWSDFKAVPNEEILAYAQTSYKIEIQPSEVLVDLDNNVQNYESLTVVAIFYPNLSWVFVKNDYLLLHEQLHFDIAELYARQMRIKFKKLKKQKNANFDSYLKAHQELWNECRKRQQLYDKETNHGQLVKENNNWIDKITKELDSY